MQDRKVARRHGVIPISAAEAAVVWCHLPGGFFDVTAKRRLIADGPFSC
ncbi:hypothetical protein [Thauera humireducens]|nr:hypothetical protein [Thauera humireducens]